MPQAALLLLSLNPSNYSSIENDAQKPTGYEAISTVLKNAISSDRISSNKQFYETYNESVISWTATTFNVEDLKSLLKTRNFIGNFFFQKTSEVASYLDQNSIYFAPKLAAAINAWQKVTSDISLLDGKTPKQAIEKFLRENASQYGLTLENGNPNQTAIEEICKIANWNPQGGVAKTPTQVKANPPTPITASKGRDKKLRLSDLQEIESVDSF